MKRGHALPVPFIAVPTSPLNAVTSLGGLGGLGGILNVLREVDIRPLKIAAESQVTLAFTSRDPAFADYFAALMYRGPGPAQSGSALRAAISLPAAEQHALSLADVVILITRDSPGQDTRGDIALVRALERAKVPVVVCFLDDTSPEGSITPPPRQEWLPSALVSAPMRNGALDEDALIQRLTKAVRALKVIDDLALARNLPAFRDGVTRALIDDVAFSNAAYSLGTGVFETNPISGIPLSVADMIILTKNQALLAYKIALAMGQASDFRTIMPQLAAVVGGGFLFRQAARGLIGLAPAGLGILPKIGVAYAGTYVTGEAVRRWCASGERLTPDVIKGIYSAALERGRELARGLIARRRDNTAVKAAPRKRGGLLPPPGD